MEEMKKCPYCGEEILAVAKKCKYCGEWLEENDVPREKSLQGQAGSDVPRTESPAPPTTAPEEVKDNGFFNYYFVDTYLHNYSNFKGAMGKKQFWMAILAGTIIAMGLYGIDFLIDPSGKQTVITTLFTAAMLLPFCAICNRRLNDTGSAKKANSVITPIAIIIVLVIHRFFFLDVMDAYGFSDESQGLTAWKYFDIFVSLIFSALWLSVILSIYWLLKKSETPCKQVRFKPADWIITILCVLSFIVGGSYMVTYDFTDEWSTVEATDGTSYKCKALEGKLEGSPINLFLYINSNGGVYGELYDVSDESSYDLSGTWDKENKILSVVISMEMGTATCIGTMDPKGFRGDMSYNDNKYRLNLKYCPKNE